MFIMKDVTTTGPSLSVFVNLPERTFQAVVSGTGAVSATVDIEVSNDNINFMVMGTISLSGTDTNTDGFAANAKWNYVRANLTAISGTGASVTVVLGVL